MSPDRVGAYFRYFIRKQPRGDVYRALLDYGARQSAYLLLVVQKGMALSSEGQQLLEQLTAFEIDDVESDRWPGTQLLGRTAHVYRYSVNYFTIEVVKNAVLGLYDWVQPERPEDLALLRADESPWLASIAHERESYLEITPEERQELLAAVPGLLLYED